MAAIAVSIVITAQYLESAPSPAETGGVYPVETVTKRGEGKATEFTWKAGGKVVSFTEHTKGKVAVLNFWATWCGPCKKETPDLVALSKEMSKDVVVVGVSVDQADNTPTIVQNFAEKFSIPYVTIIDNSKIAESYGAIQSIPTTFIIDASGRVVQKIVGLQSKAQFEAAVKRALGQ